MGVVHEINGLSAKLYHQTTDKPHWLAFEMH
jgi:hypothetical protein